MARLINVFAIVFFTLVITTGCASNKQLDDGYQFGDGLAMLYHTAGKVVSLQRLYCTESDPEIRESLLRVIRLTYEDYPADGFCTNLDTILDRIEERRLEEIAEDGPPPLAPLDAPVPIGAEGDVMGKSTEGPADPNLSTVETDTSEP